MQVWQTAFNGVFMNTKQKTVEGFTKKDILKTLFNKVLKGTTSVHSCGKTMSNSKSY